MKKALITGITGQDGSYLAEFLLEKGHDSPFFGRLSGADCAFGRTSEFPFALCRLGRLYEYFAGGEEGTA